MAAISMFRFYNDGLVLIRGSGDLRSALGNLIQLAANSAHSTSASIYLLDASAQVLKPLASYGMPDSYLEKCGHIPAGEQCCGKAVEQGMPWVVSDMLTDALFANVRDVVLDSPIRASFSVPIILDSGECIGALGCQYSRPYTPTCDEIDRTSLWAALIGHTLNEYRSSAATA